VINPQEVHHHCHTNIGFTHLRDEIDLLLQTLSDADERKGKANELWYKCISTYRNISIIKKYEAIALSLFYYDRVLGKQVEENQRIHKGGILFTLSDFMYEVGFNSASVRYCMLAYCEDAINDKGDINRNTSAAFMTLMARNGLSIETTKQYAAEIYTSYLKDKHEGMFPESLLRHLNLRWLNFAASVAEANAY